MPAATTHTVPLYWRSSRSHASNAISGRSYLVGAATVRWKMSTPWPSAATSLGTRSDSSVLPATANALVTMMSAAGAMHRVTPATNVPCPVYGGIGAGCRAGVLVLGGIAHPHPGQPRVAGAGSGSSPVSAR